jgi:hypothetical protein
MISEMTRGWRILESGQWRARQKMMMMEAWCLVSIVTRLDVQHT